MESNIPNSGIDMENFLSRRLGDKEAAEVMDYIRLEVDKRVAMRVGESRTEIDTWRADMNNSFATKEDAVALQNKLVKRVSSVEGTLILWGFVFWITIIVAVYVIFRFMH